MTTSTSQSPDFQIKSNGIISGAFIDIGIYSFAQAATFITRLPYKRNKNKNDVLAVFADQCGTCGTKHAVLKRLAEENNFDELKLMLGIFKMNADNTPEVANTLKINNLSYIPEAHNYLRYRGQLLDYTKPDFKLSKNLNDLLQENEFKPEQISGFKVVLLKKYLKKWLLENKEVMMSPGELWKVREQCIADLS